MNQAARTAVFVLEQDSAMRQEVCAELARICPDVRGFGLQEELLPALEIAPAVCLLDMDSPEAGGLEICRHLRAQGDDQAHVILSSRHDNIQLRLNAYDAGCNDYIQRPLIPEEIVRKVDGVLKAHAQVAALSSQLDYAMSTAFSAMSTMAEMGTVMKFMREVFACDTPQQIIDQTIAACRDYELNTLVACRLGDSSLAHSEHGPASPLECSLLEHARNNDRITQFSGRLSISYPHLTLLVTNWPKTDEDRAGRLRDHLAFVAEAADIRCKVLEHDTRRLQRTETILEAVNGLMRMVDYLRERQQSQRESVMRMVADQGDEIARSFYRMGLTDAQEGVILNLVSSRGAEICEQMAGFGLEQERMLEGIIETMKSLAED
ncbi:PleD family two-component system response regulator [Uliginosibacterium sp. 31-12]|uniref:response regulator n=1 Tax=Uliginosibacterium sp. 31-12 TaxID=3062781 RepID=UPI0026E35362|nr:response regulator [Uliginosibacterium sp. 31-12]MDO6387529.1 response regulator [Uliginosibacterium sp. 31-12]